MLRFAFELIASGTLEHVISSSDGDFLPEPIPSDVSGYLGFSWPPGVKQDQFRMLTRVQSLAGLEGGVAPSNPTLYGSRGPPMRGWEGYRQYKPGGEDNLTRPGPLARRTLN